MKLKILISIKRMELAPLAIFRRNFSQSQRRKDSSPVFKFSTKTKSTQFRNMDEKYQRAIEALNGLQTNHSVLNAVKTERRKELHLNLPRAVEVLQKSGMSMADLNSLKVIHVAGTKGKGSTCAFAESILRHRGLKTGLYTSPHLVSVTERVRIGGIPISKEKFANYFWEVYNSVMSSDPKEYRPPYFKFLTAMAFYIFWKEKVDVAVVEVGIGGRYDCTNIVQNPVVCAITTLDIDHTSVLGNTIEEIAWQKAGIMKKGTPTIIDGHQKPSALEVIFDEAHKVGSQVVVAPDLSRYDWAGFPPESLSMCGQVYRRNSSVALQICRLFYDEVFRGGYKMETELDDLTANSFRIEYAEAVGLKLCLWPGRNQLITKKSGEYDVQYYLDGAHTLLSMENCVEWFNTVSGVKNRLRRFEAKKILIFNLTKDRKPYQLLNILKTCGFHQVIFTNNIVHTKGAKDNVNHTVSLKAMTDQCQELSEIWKEATNGEIPSSSATSVNEALDTVLEASFKSHVQVLVTGSLLLVGNALQVLDPLTCHYLNKEEESRVLELYKRCAVH